jgi:predicted transposase YdaD
MVIEGHGHGRREDRKKKRNQGMDEDLVEIRERMEELALLVQQNAKTHWVYE